MTTIESLVAARNILEHEGKWTKHLAARDEYGYEVGSWSPAAVCFCAYGALSSVTSIEYIAEPTRLLSSMMDGSIPISNDKKTTTHLHVLMAYDFAILAAMDEE
jgi:hypothetical protein